MKKIEVTVRVEREKDILIALHLMRVDDENPDDIRENKPHLIRLYPGDDLTHFRAQNEAHLAQPREISGIDGAPWPKIPDEEWAEVEAIVALLHTPERIAKRIAKDEKARLKITQAVRTK